MSEAKTVAGAYDKIKSHEDVCALRYENINTTLGELKGAAKQHERAAWGIVLALLGWMAVQLYNGQARGPERPSTTVAVAASATR